MMLNESWMEILNERIHRLHRRKCNPKIAVIGIGNIFKGDDAVGCHIAQAVKDYFTDYADILVIDGGTTPENFSSLLRRFAPDFVLMIDAAQMGEPPGEVRLFDWSKTATLNSSTHTFSISLLATYLTAVLGCEITVLGIQPAAMEMYSPLSKSIKKTLTKVTSALPQILLARQKEPFFIFGNKQLWQRF